MIPFKHALILVNLFSFFLTLPTIHGPVIIDLGNSPSLIEVSSDARILLITFKSGVSPRVYENNKNGFSLKQTFSSCWGGDLSLSRAGRVVIC